jgi:hypothetical protein
VRALLGAHEKLQQSVSVGSTGATSSSGGGEGGQEEEEDGVGAGGDEGSECESGGRGGGGHPLGGRQDGCGSAKASVREWNVDRDTALTSCEQVTSCEFARGVRMLVLPTHTQ